MKAARLTSLLVLLLVLASFALSCGSSGRHLQSISISQTMNGQQIQFVATGTFSAPPTTVTPLPVSWGFGLSTPPPRSLSYTLTTQPLVYDCTAVDFFSTVSVVAPSDPNAPTNGTLPFDKIVAASASIQCP